jgi:hypothetical protein
VDLWLILLSITALTALLFRWMDRIGGSPLYDSRADDMPQEPCWTDEIRSEGGLSYRRSGCYHARIDQMERRVRHGDLQPQAEG